MVTMRALPLTGLPGGVFAVELPQPVLHGFLPSTVVVHDEDTCVPFAELDLVLLHLLETGEETRRGR